MFFVKYNDPIYVKLEKLDIMIRLSHTANIGNVLAELKEYVSDIQTFLSGLYSFMGLATTGLIDYLLVQMCLE